ncbi:MAG: hypothetical protein OSA45_15745, partial [Halioglobus sp.]|nr:hypothetical protein [Halioglobus sp.]
MRTLSALILLIFVTACSHPLEIAGDGDINSSTGENDCLLEDQPCGNYVLGNYDVTYIAQPRAGWFFSEWEGCGDQHPHCSFNIPGNIVNLFWGETTPALKAVFTQSPPPGNRLVTLNVNNVEAKPFGDIFRSVNLDA